jgi:hypothetical protein
VSAFRLLDLFCGAGGAGMGYHRAGFEVVGVDIAPQPHYPFEFHQGDALKYIAAHGHEFDAIHASPPCQRYSIITKNVAKITENWPDLVEPVRQLLVQSGKPYVIENVVGAPLRVDLLLCGSMFGLGVARHRIFESNITMPLLTLTCRHENIYNPYAGKPGERTANRFRQAMGIDWMPTSGGASRKRGVSGDLSNAIPPAYTEFIGRQLMKVLEAIHE